MDSCVNKYTVRANGKYFHSLTFQSNDPKDFLRILKNKEDSLKICLCQCYIPEFEVKTITEELINYKQILGKLIVLNFWFSDCGPCLKEFPVLEKVSEYYSSKDVIFISISFRNTSDELHRFIMQNGGFGYQIVSSEGAKLITKKMPIETIPQNYIIGKDGKIKKVWTGISDEDDVELFGAEMKEIIDKLL